MTTFTSSLDSSALREFFNRKAGVWHAKYAESGPLRHRLRLFGAHLEQSLPPPAQVLELGCGTGNLAAHLASRGYRLVACDIADEMLAEARRAFPAAGIEWKHVIRGSALPVAEGTFDAVVASSVFEYVDDLRFAFAECHRVLRPGGVLLFSVPTPGNPHRRLEALLTPLASVLRGLPVRWPARLQGYLDYLRLSKNRCSVARWEALAAAGGFEANGPPDFGASTLTLLRFRRSA